MADGKEKVIQDNIAYLKKKAAQIDSLLKSENFSTETKNELLSARKYVEELYKKVRDENNYRKANYLDRQEGKPEYIYTGGDKNISAGLDLSATIQERINKINFKKQELDAETTDSQGNRVSTSYLVDALKDVTAQENASLQQAKSAGTRAGSAIVKAQENQNQAKATENQNQAKAVPVKGGGASATWSEKGDPKEGDKRLVGEKIFTFKEGKWRGGGKQGSENYQEFSIEEFTKLKSEPLIETELNGKKVRYNPKDKTWYNAEQKKTSIGQGNKSPLSIPELIELRNQKELRPYIDDQKIIDAGFRLLDTDVPQSNGKGKNNIAETAPSNVPQRSTTSTGGRKGTGSGIVAKEAPPTRETPTTEGIALKGLTGERVAHAMNRGFSGQKGVYFQPDIKQGSVKELVDTTGKDGGLKSALGKLSGLAEYAPDAFRMGLGLLGASEKVPEYEIPQEFMDYKSKLREMSTQGLSEQELANAYKDAERAYSYNVKGIRDMAGGRAGVGLANLGAATTNLGRAYEDINVADAAMRRQNLGMYGSALGTYIGLDRQQFEDKQQLALMNKQAGAQLAATALSDMQARADYNKTYGKGSIYEDYMKQMVEGLRLQNEMYQYQLDNPPDFTQGTFAPQQLSTQTAVSPYTAPMFFYNPYFQQSGK